MGGIERVRVRPLSAGAPHMHLCPLMPCVITFPQAAYRVRPSHAEEMQAALEMALSGVAEACRLVRGGRLAVHASRKHSRVSRPEANAGASHGGERTRTLRACIPSGPARQPWSLTLEFNPASVKMIGVRTDLVQR